MRFLTSGLQAKDIARQFAASVLAFSIATNGLFGQVANIKNVDIPNLNNKAAETRTYAEKVNTEFKQFEGESVQRFNGLDQKDIQIETKTNDLNTNLNAVDAEVKSQKFDLSDLKGKTGKLLNFVGGFLDSIDLAGILVDLVTTSALGYAIARVAAESLERDNVLSGQVNNLGQEINGIKSMQQAHYENIMNVISPMSTNVNQIENRTQGISLIKNDTEVIRNQGSAIQNKLDDVATTDFVNRETDDILRAVNGIDVPTLVQIGGVVYANTNPIYQQTSDIKNAVGSGNLNCGDSHHFGNNLSEGIEAIYCSARNPDAPDNNNDIKGDEEVDLTQLKKLLQELKATIGEPFSTPSSLINDPLSIGIKPHTSICSILSWWIEQMDALVGEFPIKLEIEDTDLMRVGDQGRRIVIPNIAECLAEITGLAINARAVTEANLDASMRTLMEAGSGRVQGIKNHYLLQSIQQYLGFSVRQKMIKVPFTYDPINAFKKDTIDDALRNSEQQIKVEENSDPDTLEKQLAILRDSAAIIRTVHTRKLSPDNVGEWKEMMRGSRDSLLKDNPDDEKDDLSRFLDQVEEGWTAETGRDVTAPYERNYSERPQIRRLNVKDDDN